MIYKIKSVVLFPPILIIFVYGIQYLIWYFFSSSTPIIVGVSPRFDEPTAINKYLFFISIFISSSFLGVITCEAMYRTTGTRSTQIGPSVMQSIAWIALVLSAIGEVVYIRPFILHPQMILESLTSGQILGLAYTAREGSLTGVSSLNNLYVIPVVIYSMLLFSTQDPILLKKCKKLLAYIFIVALIHSFLLSARMFVTYYIVSFCIVASFFKIEMIKRNFIKIAFSIFAFLCFIIINEYFRNSVTFMEKTGNPILSIETFKYITGRLLNAYVTSDLNNAMIVLNCEPSMQLVSTSALSSAIKNPIGYSSCEYWHSLYSTMNIVGLAWFDLGYYGVIYVSLIGLSIGFSYSILRRKIAGLTAVMAVVIISGIFHGLRINYYGLSMFILSATYIVIAAIVIRAGGARNYVRH